MATAQSSQLAWTGLSRAGQPRLPPLRVLLDARKLFDGGIGSYIGNVIQGVSALDDARLTIVVRPEVLQARAIEQAPWAGRVAVISDPAPPYSVDEMWRMARRLPQARHDVFHVPHYTLPFGLKIPAVATIHDTIHISHPEKLYYPFVAKRLLRSALNRAERIVAVSKATYRSLEEFSYGRGLETGKLRVVPNALDPFFMEPVRGCDYVQQRFGISGNYFLAVVSMLKPHKGLKDLLQVFRKVKARLQAERKSDLGSKFSDIKLLLAGRATEELVQAESFASDFDPESDVYLLGHVAKRDLLNLYAAARALIVPSLAEGFFLPALEAHAQGTPVIARPVPAVKELLTQDDFQAADFSAEALEEVIWRFMKAHEGNSAYKKRPMPAEVLRQYDCVELARALMQVYREAQQK